MELVESKSYNIIYKLILNDIAQTLLNLISSYITLRLYTPSSHIILILNMFKRKKKNLLVISTIGVLLNESCTHQASHTHFSFLLITPTHICESLFS